MNNIPAPVFILCHGRTGSTLLSLVLDSHENIWAPPEVHVSKLISGVVGVSEAYAIPHFPVNGVESNAEKNARQAEARRNAKEFILDIVRRHMPEGKTVWCQKSVATFEDIELVSDVFTKARYICLYRNCLDFVKSAMERSHNGWRKYGFEDCLLREVVDKKHQSSFPDALCRFWCDRVEKLVQFEREHRSMCQRVRYEQLVLYARDTCNQLFSFLGLKLFAVRSDKSLWDLVFKRKHQRGAYLGCPKAHTSTTINRSPIGSGSDVDREHVSDETWSRVMTLQRELGYSSSSFNRFYRGGFEDRGKGTPLGDGKDKAMRDIADKAIVELDDAKRESSSRTTRDTLGMYNGESDVIVMLARNGSLKGTPLRSKTTTLVQQACKRNCAFVVGDMPGVDTAFTDLLDKTGAAYTVYHCGSHCRIYDYLEGRSPQAEQTAGGDN